MFGKKGQAETTVLVVKWLKCTMLCIRVLLTTFLFILNEAHVQIERENCSALYSRSNSSDTHCPLWFTVDQATGECKRGPRLDGIIEQDMSLMKTWIMQCYCMTEDDDGVLSVGFCLEMCVVMKFPYYTLPCDASQLQNWSCPPHMNRRGYLCSQCIEDYGIPAYSYTMECVKCKEYQYNWMKYLAVVYIPLTLFYIVVALFSINFASPTFSGVVLFFQIAANPVFVQLALQHFHNKLSPAMDIAISFASLWNLDFFRNYYKFCLYPNASAILIMALELPVAVFPLVLIGVTFTMVKLHDQNFKPLVVGWKIIHKILRPVRRNIRTSFIEVFASFIFLSCSRLLLASVYILIPFTLYSYHPQSGGLAKRYYALGSPTVEYFGKEHLPFALLAIVLSTTFFAVPMLLLFLYPFSWFQCILNRLRCNSIVLHTFMDVFQGGYKDGNNGKRDYRYFSGFILLFPLVMCLTFVLTVSRYFYYLMCLWIAIYLTLYLVFQPFKCCTHNYVFTGILFVLLGGLWGTASVSHNEVPFSLSYFPPLMSIIVSLLVPSIYVCGLACVLLRTRICILLHKI